MSIVRDSYPSLFPVFHELNDRTQIDSHRIESIPCYVMSISKTEAEFNDLFEKYHSKPIQLELEPNEDIKNKKIKPKYDFDQGIDKILRYKIEED